MQEIIKIENVEGDLRVSSRLIAEHFEKEHRNVLQSIEEIKKGVAEKSADLFKESKYQHQQNKQWYKEYLMTRDGFTLLAMGFTGKKALDWKLKYIEAFNQMGEKLRNDSQYQYENLSTEMKALLMHDKKIQAVEKEVKKVDKKFDDLPLFQTDLKLLKKLVNQKVVPLLGGKKSPAYKAMSKKVFSDIYRQIHREFGVTGCEEIKRTDLELVKAVIGEYELPMVLETNINMMNSQMAFV